MVRSQHCTSFFREELEKQRAAKAYQKLHQAGKTEEARRDLARLALIRQQREEAARKRAKGISLKSYIYTYVLLPIIYS